MGLGDERGPQLAVVLALASNKASLAIGTSARKQIQPLRQLLLLTAFSGECDPPQRLSQAPWSISDDALTAVLPSRSDFAAAWILMQAEPQGLQLSDWVDLVSSRRDGLAIASCWRWCLGPQTLFRLRQNLVEARPLTDLRRLRRERRLRVLQEQAEMRWQQQLRDRQPLDLQLLSAEQRQQLDLLVDWAGGECTTPLPLPLRQALQAAKVTADTGSIRHLLVDLGQWQAHNLPSLRATVWEQGFSADLLADAEHLLVSAETELPGDAERLDLSGQRSITIDDADTCDIDDGLALETTPAGQVKIWIHVADPGRLIALDSPLDLEARRRGSSLYLASGILPMFPEALATGPMSLRAGHRSAAWSIWVELDGDGAVKASGLQRSWVKPTYRLSYGDADDLIDLAPPQERDSWPWPRPSFSSALSQPTNGNFAAGGRAGSPAGWPGAPLRHQAVPKPRSYRHGAKPPFQPGLAGLCPSHLADSPLRRSSGATATAGTSTGKPAHGCHRSSRPAFRLRRSAQAGDTDQQGRPASLAAGVVCGAWESALAGLFPALAAAPGQAGAGAH